VPDIAAFTLTYSWQAKYSLLNCWSPYVFHIVFPLVNVTLLCHVSTEGFCFGAIVLTTRLIITCSRQILVPQEKNIGSLLISDITGTRRSNNALSLVELSLWPSKEDVAWKWDSV
jgi:hypothetical protein